MGYSLTIGEAQIESYNEDGLEAECRIYVKSINDPESPAFGDPTDHTNHRWPSYTAWNDFAEFTGLWEALFQNDGNIRGGHPGAFPINKDFKTAVDDAYKNHMVIFPDAVPTYETERPQDYQLCRLLWLQYWTDWALENCDNPVMANS